ncbi:MAG: T9SS type A sorting domain-containing protein [Saprospiraceae bacterium]|nr:T9SS type A sorting domain-containing protein [Saprospiraceae bacterium]
MYIAYTGNGTSGNATSFLTSNSNYVRIDGPTVWIEFACQNGVVIQNQIHYHSVWRDHVHDYGVDLSGEAIDVTTGTNDLQLSLDISIFPNPSTDQITIFFPEDLKKATITVFDMMGKAVYNKTHSGATTTVDVHSLPLGNYILKAQEGDRIYSGKFVRN